MKRLFRTAAVPAAFIAVLTACGAKAAPVSCAELTAGSADSAVMILTDHASTAFDRTTEHLMESPDAFFESPALGDGFKPGIVIIATVNDDATVAELGRFNFDSGDRDNVRASANAKKQAECLAKMLPTVPAEATEPVELLRALSDAQGVLGATNAEHQALIVHGLGRSQIEQTATDDIDLSDDARAGVLAQLDAVDLIPDLTASVVMVAPSEGVESAIAAAQVDAFAVDLCSPLTSGACTTMKVFS